MTLRRYAPEDFDTLVAQWHATNLESYPYVAEQQRHSLADARVFFRQKLLPACDVHVAEDDHGVLAGMIALELPWIRQLTVFPGFQRRGLGSALLCEAQRMAPGDLRLFTFARNAKARSFYEHHGFVAVAFGISPAPELEPDVEYRWMQP
ncbi:MAG: GNAT family N-acetyltransferase [Casimicrobiaceae bacterium]